MIGHVRQRDQDSKEAENMQDQDKTLKSREQLPSDSIDGDRKDRDGPEQEGSVPAMRLIIAVCEDDQSLNQTTAEITRCRVCGLPPNDGKPAWVLPLAPIVAFSSWRATHRLDN